MSDSADDFLDADDSELAALTKAVADGIEVDWSEAESSVVGEESHRIFDELRTIAKLARVFRSQVVEDLQSSSSAELPESWRHLKIREHIGHGSYGTVYRAWEPRLDREVALKLLPQLAAHDADAVVEEARLLARVRHQNVVAVFGADHQDGCAGLWMELIHGRTLKQFQCDSGSCSAEEAALFGLDLCRALAAVHKAGFLHRDVKAQNVMREAGGRIVLMDFGAAAVLGIERQAGAGLQGTPLYLAPEVLDGRPATVQSDLYSLGVLLYFLVSGDFPVGGQSLADIRTAHKARQRRLLRDIRPDLPSAFVRVIDEATAELPENRPRSAGAMEAALERAMGRTTVRPAPAPPLEHRDDSSRSIAVLRFANISAKKSLDFFCDGMTEEIITALSAIPGLRVIAATSALRFTSGVTDLREVGTLLNVGTVLEGSVRVSADRMRVIARMVSTADESQLWAQRFECPVRAVFAVQDEIAAAAVAAMGVRLNPQTKGPTTRESGTKTGDSEAHHLYLKGRHCWNQRTEAALHKSVTYFEAAIAKDPGYANAYAGLAESYATLGLYGAMAPHDAMPQARDAAARAIAAGCVQASPSTTLACIAAVYDWNWADAERAYRRAIDQSPNDPAVHHWYAINYLVPLKRFAEAEAELQLAIAGDPLSMPIRLSVGLSQYFARDYDSAVRELTDSLEVEVGSATARLFLGLALIEMQRFEEAAGHLETAVRLAGSPEMTAALAYGFARAGQMDRARSALADLLAMAGARYVSPSLPAQVYAALGDSALALTWLERAADAHAADLAWLAVRPVFDALRPDPRFKAILQRLNL